ncbi:MucR family transcriptional regulator [Effusibacillus consociatus]|uniref:MucR family transcriptional regulator n=1 Tax=Effusibacillus consociatus TaxID=1117041 RepID=A0ABV9Q0V0_9BACL
MARGDKDRGNTEREPFKDEIIFDTYVICPLCKVKLDSLTSSHLQHKHGYSGLKEYKMEFGIPMGVPLVAHKIRANMQKER